MYVPIYYLLRIADFIHKIKHYAGKAGPTLTLSRLMSMQTGTSRRKP